MLDPILMPGHGLRRRGPRGLGNGAPGTRCRGTPFPKCLVGGGVRGVWAAPLASNGYPGRTRQKDPRDHEGTHIELFTDV